MLAARSPPSGAFELDDEEETTGLALANLDDIYIVSNDPNALEDVQAFFSARQPSIQLNMAKSKTTALASGGKTVQLSFRHTKLLRRVSPPLRFGIDPTVPQRSTSC
jgi:hypothetical protein